MSRENFRLLGNFPEFLFGRPRHILLLCMFSGSDTTGRTLFGSPVVSASLLLSSVLSGSPCHGLQEHLSGVTRALWGFVFYSRKNMKTPVPLHTLSKVNILSLPDSEVIS